MTTIRCEIINTYSDMRLIWDNHVTEDDIRAAFASVMDTLNRADHPLHIIVDMQSDPHIPMAVTLHEVMQGPFRHPHMGQWLCVGSNQRAETIASIMSKNKPDVAIRWFRGMAEAEAALADLRSG